MEPDHIEEKWAPHPLVDPQLSSSTGRSSRPRRDSHSRRHHRDREGGRGSTKSKVRSSATGLDVNITGLEQNPAHRSTRYKEKFQALREKYDRVLAIRDTIEHDLYIATEKMDKIQAENDLLLDAIHAASPDLMDLVSPILIPRQLPPHPHPHYPYAHPLPHTHTQPYPNPNSHSTSSTPHPHPPLAGPTYDPPPGPAHSPSLAPNSTNGHVNMNTNGEIRLNGSENGVEVMPQVQAVESVLAPEDEENAMR